MKSTKILIPVFIIGFIISCQESPVDSFQSHERAIVDFRISGQIGVPDITRNVDLAEIVIYVTEDTDWSAVTPDIMVSYNATISPASGETVNFADNNGEYTYIVTSESGRTREWTVRLQYFQSNLSGTWRVTEIEFEYRFGGDESWAWGGVRPLYWDLGSAENAIGNLFNFIIEGIDDEGRIYGSFVQEPGGGSDSDFPEWGEWAYKFDRIPAEPTTYLRDFSTDRVIFNAGTENEHVTQTLRFSGDEQTLEIGFDLQRDIDWGTLNNLTAAREFWYTLEKVD
jgi:hypothetical protein